MNNEIKDQLEEHRESHRKWLKETQHKLRKGGIKDDDTICDIMGSIIEHLMLYDRQGYKRGFDDGYEWGIKKPTWMHMQQILPKV
jgi:hypothetical protein